MRLKFSVILVVLLVLGLACSSTFAARHRSRDQRKHREVRMILPQIPQIPIEVTPEQVAPEFNFTIPVIEFYPKLVPANENSTLYIRLLEEFPIQNASYCCIFGRNDSSIPATVNGTWVQCEIPALNKSGCVNTYIAPCFNASSPVSSNFSLVFYNHQPNITDVYPGVIHAVGGQEVSFNISHHPWNDTTGYCNASFSYGCKADNHPFVWPARVHRLSNNETIINCTSPSLPIGTTNISVIFYYDGGNNTNHSIIVSHPYPVTVESVQLEDFSPKTGCITGGTIIALNITSYPRMLNITTNSTNGNHSLPFCHFAPKYELIPGHVNFDREVTPVLFDEAHNQFYCRTPAWNYTETTAILTLVDPVFFAPLSNPVTFEFITTCLDEVFPYSAPICAIGSVPVFISGTLLPDNCTIHNNTRNSTEIAIAFIYADAAKTQLIANKTFHCLNNSAGYFLTSPEEFRYNTTYVQIGTGFHIISPEFKLESTNSCIASVHPETVPVAGGAKVVLTMFNDIFVFHNSTYYCYFVDSLGYPSTIAATPVAANQIGCTTPRASGPGVGSVSLVIRYRDAPARVTSPIPISFERRTV